MCAWSGTAPMRRRWRNSWSGIRASPGCPMPGWRSSPYRALARKYMPRGAGAVFTFGVRGGYEAGIKLVESVRLFSHLANIGDTRSLILHPASTTHRQLTRRAAAGGGRRAGCDPAVDRAGDGGGSDRRSGSGAGGGCLRTAPSTANDAATVLRSYGSEEEKRHENDLLGEDICCQPEPCRGVRPAAPSQFARWRKQPEWQASASWMSLRCRPQ